MAAAFLQGSRRKRFVVEQITGTSLQKVRDREDALANTRDACATQRLSE
jgi:hypothetical protein